MLSSVTRLLRSAALPISIMLGCSLASTCSADDPSRSIAYSKLYRVSGPRIAEVGTATNVGLDISMAHPPDAVADLFSERFPGRTFEFLGMPAARVTEGEPHATIVNTLGEFRLTVGVNSVRVDEAVFHGTALPSLVCAVGAQGGTVTGILSGSDGEYAVVVSLHGDE